MVPFDRPHAEIEISLPICVRTMRNLKWTNLFSRFATKFYKKPTLFYFKGVTLM